MNGAEPDSNCTFFRMYDAIFQKPKQYLVINAMLLIALLWALWVGITGVVCFLSYVSDSLQSYLPYAFGIAILWIFDPWGFWGSNSMLKTPPASPADAYRTNSNPNLELEDTTAAETLSEGDCKTHAHNLDDEYWEELGSSRPSVLPEGPQGFTSMDLAWGMRGPVHEGIQYMISSRGQLAQPTLGQGLFLAVLGTVAYRRSAHRALSH